MRLTACLLALLTLSVAPASEAQEPEPGPAEGVDAGGDLFFTHCGPCHGKTAEGDGPVASSLEFVPPDLTRIAIRNGGEFPADLVRRIVDGRKAVKGHGGPEMPIWGDAFKTREEGFSEEAVAEKIRAIVSWLATVQKTGE